MTMERDPLQEAIDIALAGGSGGSSGTPASPFRIVSSNGRTFLFDQATGRYEEIPGVEQGPEFSGEFLGELPIFLDEGGRPFVIEQEMIKERFAGRTVEVGGPQQVRYLTGSEVESLRTQPAGPAPRAPLRADTYVDPRGNLIGIDPVTGEERFRIPGAGTPALTPTQQRSNQFQDFQLTEASKQRAEERAAAEQRRREQAAATEGRLTREQIARQNALDRAQRASEFAAGTAFREREFEAAQQERAFSRSRAMRADRLAAARQLSDVISDTDPAAFAAFLEGGGGNIANSLAGGGTALSNNAMLAAARTLAAAEAPGPSFAPTNPLRTTPAGDHIGAGGFAGGTPEERAAWLATLSPEERAAVDRRVDRRAREQYAAALKGNPTAPRVGSPIANRLGALADRSGGVVERRGRWFERNDRPLDVQFAADGMDRVVTRPTLIVAGEGGQPERVNIDPISGRRNLATAADNPFLDRIRALREGVDFPDLNPFDVSFRNRLPTIRELFFRGRQAKFGVPVRDQLAEEARFRLPGTSRGAFRVIM